MASSDLSGDILLEFEDEDELDPNTRENMTRTLLGQINDMDVSSAGLVERGPLPDGAKSAFLVDVGAITVSLLLDVLPTLVKFLAEWKQRGAKRRVKIKVRKGDNYVDVEFDSEALSSGQIGHVVQKISQAITPSG